MAVPPAPSASDPCAARKPVAGVAYRTGDLGDAETVTALAHAVYGGPADAWWERMNRALRRPSSCLVLAHAAGEPVGYGKAGWCDNAGGADPAPTGMYLTGLVVLPAWRRCGIGEELTRRRMNWVGQRGETAWVFTNARNRASLALHTRLGFVEAGRAAGYLGEAFDGGLGVLLRADATTCRSPSSEAVERVPTVGG